MYTLIDDFLIPFIPLAKCSDTALFIHSGDIIDKVQKLSRCIQSQIMSDSKNLMKQA